jgi:hypothetical protein
VDKGSEPWLVLDNIGGNNGMELHGTFLVTAPPVLEMGPKQDVWLMGSLKQ